MYASGMWIVKKGREDDFARAWQASADKAALEFGGVTFRLLRDVENPRRFVAISGPWRTAEQLASARATEGFQELVQAAAELTESAELSTFELAAEVS